MKRVNKLLVLSTLTSSLIMGSAGVSAASIFKDVKDGDWADDEIEFLYDQQITSGYPNGLFMTNKLITKSQIAVMIAKSLNLYPSKNSKIQFTDVTKKHSSYNEFVAVVEAGIFPKESKFNPNVHLTKAEVAEVLVNAFNIKGEGTVQIKDVLKTSAHYDEIAALVENDIAAIGKNQQFMPNKKVTRIEFAVLLARILNTDFLPTQYNIAQNVNPILTLFDYVIKNPEGIKSLFTLNDDFGFGELSNHIKKLELSNFKEIARLNGTTEFVVHVNVDLDINKQGLLVDGENELYFLIQKDDYMDFSIVSINTKPHLRGDDSISFSNRSAVSLIGNAKKSYWHVVSGGEGTGEVKTFTKDGLEYRYMSESLDTESKLKAYLGQTYTPEQVEILFKDLGFITNNGKLAQPNADGGSLLNFEKATATLVSNSTTVKKYELNVPVGDTKEIQKMIGELHFVEGKGWRVHSLK